jgi:hypothetical protein
MDDPFNTYELQVGNAVVRGPDWKYGDQDYGVKDHTDRTDRNERTKRVKSLDGEILTGFVVKVGHWYDYGLEDLGNPNLALTFSPNPIP